MDAAAGSSAVPTSNDRKGESLFVGVVRGIPNSGTY
jgi:hypothetical protein